MDLARTAAALAEEAIVSRPVGAYVNGRVAFDQSTTRKRPWRRYERCSPRMAGCRSPTWAPLDRRNALQRLERFSEAESLLLEELRDYPLNGRARSAGLTAAHYAATG